MDARWLVVTFACAAILAGSAVERAAAQERMVTLKLATFAPEPSSASRWLKLKKEELAKQSNGRLNLE
ncbi:MAG TPA: hypothetical protein VGB90_10590, partial [Alphaproteobacteria bacterium]